MFIVVEHVETGTGWGEQHGISRLAQLEAAPDRLGHRLDPLERSGSGERRADLLRRRPDQNHLAATLPDQLAQWTEVTPLVLAPQNDDDSAGKGLEGFDGRVDIGRL